MAEDKVDVLGRADFIQKLVEVVELLSDSKQGCCFGVNGVLCNMLWLLWEL